MLLCSQRQSFPISFKGWFHLLKLSSASFLRPRLAEWVPPHEEVLMGFFCSCHVPHWVILMSMDLHSPLYIPKVFASYFEGITVISVGSHAQSATGCQLITNSSPAANPTEKSPRMLLTQVLVSFRFMMGHVSWIWLSQMIWKDTRNTTVKMLA